jgi:hypothetical protein
MVTSGQKERELMACCVDSIEMDMNNRKAENRSDQKGYDIAIEVSRSCLALYSCWGYMTDHGGGG